MGLESSKCNNQPTDIEHLVTKDTELPLPKFTDDTYITPDSIVHIPTVEEQKTLPVAAETTPNRLEPSEDTEMSSISLLVATTGLSAVLLTQRGGSLKNIKQNLVQQKKANAKQPMNPQQKKLRRRKRKK